MRGHSRSVIENQAVSRLRPLTTSAWRKIPSKRNPYRAAEARDDVRDKPAIGPPRQIGPHPAVAVLAVGCVKLGGMPAGIERLDPAEPAGDRRARRPLPRRPALDRKPDRLTQMIGMLGHDRSLRASECRI